MKYQFDLDSSMQSFSAGLGLLLCRTDSGFVNVRAWIMKTWKKAKYVAAPQAFYKSIFRALSGSCNILAGF